MKAFRRAITSSARARSDDGMVKSNRHSGREIMNPDHRGSATDKQRRLADLERALLKAAAKRE
jgi:hypothetical protein